MNNQQEFFVIGPACAQRWPGFKAGILIVGDIESSAHHSEIQEVKAKVEAGIRSNFSSAAFREELNKLPVIAAYNNYYKQFDKSYVVRAQVESIIKGKSLPNIFALLDCMFAAELKNMLLTAGHDLNKLKLPITLTMADGVATYIGIGGGEKKTYKDDLIMKDGEGIISTIINGPDDRTKITPATKNALFAVYAPAEISAEVVSSHLNDIKTNIALFSKNSQVNMLEVFEV